MKLRTKDEIITCLIDSLSQDVENTEIHEDYIHDGKIKNVANKILYLFAIIIPLINTFVILR